VVVEIAASTARTLINPDDGGPVYVAVARGDCVCGADHGDHVWLLLQRTVVGLITQLTAVLLESGLTEADIHGLVVKEFADLQITGNPDAGQLVVGCPACDRAQPECVCDHEWAVR